MWCVRFWSWYTELFLVGSQCVHPDLRIPCTSKALVFFRKAVRHQPMRRRVVTAVRRTCDVETTEEGGHVALLEEDALPRYVLDENASMLALPLLV